MNVWDHYTKKIREKFTSPKFVGSVTPSEAEVRNMHLAVAESGSLEEGFYLAFYCLVDPSDGIIADVKYQAFGSPFVVALAEIEAELILRKNYLQASRLSADLLEQGLKDHKQDPSFPKEFDVYFNRALCLLDQIVESCMEIPVANNYLATPVTIDMEGGESVEGWFELTKEVQLSLLENILTKEIRPYIELDEGGIKLIDLKEGREVIIAYEGSCTTCHSSTGSTLSAVQNIFRVRIDKNLFVTPLLK